MGVGSSKTVSNSSDIFPPATAGGVGGSPHPPAPLPSIIPCTFHQLHGSPLSLTVRGCTLELDARVVRE